jgi:hypothetical protein
MRRRKLNAEARMSAASFTEQVIIFASVWRYAL